MNTQFDTTMWGIHAGRTGEAHNLFINKGYIALGWKELGDLSQLGPTREYFKEALTVARPNYKPNAIPGAAGQLFRFTHEVETGDFVVYRSKTTRLVYIGRITQSYEYRPELDSNYPHVRKTEWLKHVEPKRATQGALYEIGSALTFFQVRNYADEWKGFLSLTSSQTVTIEPDEDDTVAIVAESIEENTRDFIIKQFETELKGHPFATFVAHLLNTMGYQTRVSPEGADGGVDIIAHRDELGFEPPIIKVQVKSGSGNVGHPEVSALIGTLAPNEFGLVVTLASFTPPARNFARNKGNLRLLDGDDIVDMTLNHYEQLDARYKGILPLKQVYVPEPIED